MVIVNVAPQVYTRDRVKVPLSGAWPEVLNTDAAVYGASDVGNARGVETLKDSTIPEVTLVAPPLAAVFLIPKGSCAGLCW